jgi:protein-S-isoprenylcysteine O-methyltransferase
MYLTVFGISLGAWLLLEVWVFLRDRGRDQGRTSAESRRSFAALAIAVALAMNIPGIAPKFDVREDYGTYFSIGIAMVWAGMLLRLWAIRTLGTFFSTQLVIQSSHSLITTGPYRFLRNPSYTGGLITMSGLGISLGNGMSLAILVLTALIVYVWRIRAEEKMLLGEFGQRYEEYKKKTWALIPFVW